MDVSFDCKINRIFQAFLDTFMNDLRKLWKKRENKPKPKPKQRKYWIVKKVQKFGQKSDFYQKQTKLCPVSGPGRKNLKQNKKTYPGYLPKFESDWKMQKLCQYGFGGKKTINIRKTIKNWLHCDIIRLKRSYPLD